MYILLLPTIPAHIHIIIYKALFLPCLHLFAGGKRFSVVNVSKTPQETDPVLYGIYKSWIFMQIQLTFTGLRCIIQCILKNKFFGGICNE